MTCSSTGLQGLLEQYSDVFKDSLGTLVGRKAKIEVDPSAQPRYFKARTLPGRGGVGETVDRRHPRAPGTF